MRQGLIIKKKINLDIVKPGLAAAEE